MRLQAIIFDMDGVLSDTEKMHGVAQEQMLQAYGIHLPAAECSRRFAGIPEKDIWPVVFLEANVPCPSVEELMDKKVKTMLELLKENIPAVEGSRALIDRVIALELRTAVASSSAPMLIETILHGLGIDTKMTCVISGHQVKHGKPAPDIFLLAAKKLAVDPTLCLVIEDANAGVKAAKVAGMACIGYKPKGSEQDLSMADVIVSSMDEVTEELLQKL